MNDGFIVNLLQDFKPSELSKQDREAIYQIAEMTAKYDLHVMDYITSPLSAGNVLLNRYRSADVEIFGVLFLNNQNGVIAVEELAHGTIDGAAIYSREVVKACIKHSANAIVCFHNHPAGLDKESEADKRITRRLKEALELIDVNLIDHLILGSGSFSSFAEKGLI